ncbi:MAG TPA: ABC transporter permease [Candidatus Acidoferrales bacterium]|nr:ABC transporter permease [Candidatus Acidoferrales bacterium]
MSAVAAVFYREGKIRMTNLTFIFWDLFYPLCYMLVFGVGINAALGSPFAAAGVDYNAFFLAGVLAMASFGIASNTAWSFFLDRDNGIFYEMLTYPLSRAQYLLGKVLFNVLVSTIQAAITIVLGRLLLGIRVRWDLLPLLFAGVVVGTAGWFFFYAIFALKTRRNDIFNSVTSIFYFVFLFASSMFYPLDPLPPWFRKAALANPITWEIDWLRSTSIGLGSARQVAVEGFAFVLFALVAFALAVRSLQQQE